MMAFIFTCLESTQLFAPKDTELVNMPLSAIRLPFLELACYCNRLFLFAILSLDQKLLGVLDHGWVSPSPPHALFSWLIPMLPSGPR